jgi:hypothetical protein
MGGFGSGKRFGLSKYTVEDCRQISAAALMREGVLRPHVHADVSVIWTDKETGKQISAVGCQVHTGVDTGTLRLRYLRTRDNETVDYIVRLTTTPLPWGGRKWWFICPLTKNEIPCQRRVGKLYLLGKYFACRHCHELTYQSCQESHKYDAILGAVGASRGLSASDVHKRLFRRGKKR